MISTLYDPKVRAVLDAMHEAADSNDPPLLAKAKDKKGVARTALLDDVFIPVSCDGGRLVYTLVRGAAPGTTVEFGTSFGISTIRPISVVVADK
jgi:predicted O-methyltransferase YrrM